MKLTPFWRRALLSLLSILLLSLGWIGSTGLPLLVALIPLLWISGEAEDSRRGWWGVFGWAIFTFVGWNLATIWWIGLATPVGPIAATTMSTLYSMIAFMSFHTISKKAPKALAYVALVSVWIALEYYYMVSDISWPWLLLGNGFSNNIWAVQWYEYTGIFGGSLWVLLSNILLYEAYITSRGSRRVAIITAIAPIAISLVIYLRYDPSSEQSLEVSVIQPNVDCYEKFAGDRQAQERLLLDLIDEVPATSDLILLPETSIPNYYLIENLERAHIINDIKQRLAIHAPNATLIGGANTIKIYKEGEAVSETAHANSFIPHMHDIYNSAVAITKSGVSGLRHKSRLVIGVENTPSWIFKVFKFFVVDLGGVVGQIGQGGNATSFDVGEHRAGAAICYEGLYGDFYGGFMRDGAQMMAIISNDGWWGDTLGHRHLYSFSSLRAVEHRRAIARSANTGTSGFITSRGDSVESLGWDQRGVITSRVALNDRLTLYTLWGDYIARLSILIAALSLLYFVAYIARRRHHLVP